MGSATDILFIVIRFMLWDNLVTTMAVVAAIVGAIWLWSLYQSFLDSYIASQVAGDQSGSFHPFLYIVNDQGEKVDTPIETLIGYMNLFEATMYGVATAPREEDRAKLQAKLLPVFKRYCQSRSRFRDNYLFGVAEGQQRIRMRRPDQMEDHDVSHWPKVTKNDIRAMAGWPAGVEVEAKLMEEGLMSEFQDTPRKSDADPKKTA